MQRRNNSKLRGYSICSGIGGLDIAFQSPYVGGETVGYCEYDKYCQSVLHRRMSDGWLDNAPIWPDLFTLEESLVGDVDVLYGGIPCQPHSHAGKRAGANAPRDLWPKTLELLREVRPRLFFLENVAGITMGTGEQGAYVYTIFNDLSKIGYDFRWTTLRASDIGAPHRRERFFLLANSNDRFSEYENSAIRTRRSSLDDGGSSVGNPSSSGQLESTNDHREAATQRRPEWIAQEKIGNTSEGRTELGDTDGQRLQGRHLMGVDTGERTSGQNGTESSIYGAMGDPGGWVRSTGYADARPQFVAYDQPGHSGSPHKYAIGEVDTREGLFQSFPPSPDSQDEWRRLIRRNPSLSPAIEPNLRRGPDGLTAGMDKYRRKGLAGLGNGVVPMQAIYAWLLLTSDSI